MIENTQSFRQQFQNTQKKIEISKIEVEKKRITFQLKITKLQIDKYQFQIDKYFSFSFDQFKFKISSTFYSTKSENETIFEKFFHLTRKNKQRQYLRNDLIAFEIDTFKKKVSSRQQAKTFR